VLSARYVLGVDTAGRVGSIALAGNGSAIASEILAPGEHSSGISRAGGTLLEGGNLGWRDIAAIGVSSGPGSFTGLRIGLAWAKGICFASGARLVLVASHEANAYRHRGERSSIATVLQGERGEVQVALWSGGDGMTRLWGPESVPERELAERLLPAAAIAGPDLRPDLKLALEAAGFKILDLDAPPPTAAAVAELGYLKFLRGEGEEDLARSAPAYGRAPNARKPSP